MSHFSLHHCAFLSQIDYSNKVVRDYIVNKAIRRASKWMALNEDPKPMIGQVGGVAVHKKPLLTLKPDYVLKPLLPDFRGVREIAFYEAIRTVSHTPMNNQLYTTFLRGSPTRHSAVYRVGECFDTLAVAFAIWLHDPVVTQSEVALKEAWRKVKREVEALQKLAKFTAPYYGVLGQTGVIETPLNPFGITEEAHLLLQDLTANFSQPCVMDLKLGVQTYEPVSMHMSLYAVRSLHLIIS
jgi:hypothetical protein